MSVLGVLSVLQNLKNLVAAPILGKLSNGLMKLTAILNLAVIILCLTSCSVPYAYFQSPLHGNTAAYRSIPLKSDSIKSATYISGAAIVGGANQHLRDGLLGFVGSIYQSHQFGYFDAYYGLTTTLGSYSIAKYDTSNYRINGLFAPRYNDNLEPKTINDLGGNKFFGGAGAIGGVSAVLPFEKGGEWRIIQIEGNWQTEFGNYRQFRTKLPDTAANIIFRGTNYLTISIGTDFVFKTRRGSFGFKNAFVTATRSETDYYSRAIYHSRTPGYFSQTYHFTTKRITGFYQLNYGNHSFGMQTGVNYKLRK